MNISVVMSRVRKNGVRIHEDIKIDTKDKRGLFNSDPIERYTALAVIPWSLVLNIQHPDLSTINMETERQALIIFLLREYAKDQTADWFPWIKLLNINQETKILLNMKMHLFIYVEHSTLGQSGVIEASLELFCTSDHLVWLHALDLSENEPLPLVPLIDFANHRYIFIDSYLSPRFLYCAYSYEANSRWFIEDQTHNLVPRSERTSHFNEQITISYGSKSNEELLFLYGFTFPTNPHHHVTLPVSLLPDDEYNIPYLLSLFDDHLSALNMCSDDEKFVKSRLFRRE